LPEHVNKARRNNQTMRINDPLRKRRIDFSKLYDAIVADGHVT
jgi:hypothetical protein